MTSPTDRCPTCGWDGDDLCRAIVILRDENAALGARMAELERVAEAARALKMAYDGVEASQDYEGDDFKEVLYRTSLMYQDASESLFVALDAEKEA